MILIHSFSILLFRLNFILNLFAFEDLTGKEGAAINTPILFTSICGETEESPNIIGFETLGSLKASQPDQLFQDHPNPEFLLWQGNL